MMHGAYNVKYYRLFMQILQAGSDLSLTFISFQFKRIQKNDLRGRVFAVLMCVLEVQRSYLGHKTR